MFSCDSCEIFANAYFEKHLRTAASEYLSGWFLEDISEVAACQRSKKSAYAEVLFQ